MRKTLFVLVLVLFGTLSAMTTEVGSIRGFMHGVEPNCSYDNWVSHVVEGVNGIENYYAPWDVQTTGFGSYREPTDTDRLQWNGLMQAWLALDFNLADSLIVQYNLPYELVHFQDSDTGREFYMLRELLNDDYDSNGDNLYSIPEVGSFDYGWGLYIYNPAASRPMMITAVHPCDGYPSPVIALEALLKWDARFLFVAGAGREVLNPGPGNNNSLSDPSRNPNHVFNIAYQLACQQIRQLTGRIEFSVQIDSYDWQRHSHFSPVMISAGNGRTHPSLPIVDHSHLKKDFIHHTPWEVFDGNTLGAHHIVYATSYYSVYSDDRILYDAFDHIAYIPLSDEIPGYVNNQQMLFTEQPNIYDCYSPFLHVSLGELPRFLYQSNVQWYEFYGWDEAAQQWNIAQRWTKFIQCYTPWLDALDEVLDDLLLMDDNTAPSNPGNFCVSNLNSSNFGLSWDRSYDYDFDSYEILISYESGGEEVEVIVDREIRPTLARQSISSVEQLFFSDYSSPMTLRIRARDKNGRYTPASEEILLYQPPPQGRFYNASVTPQEGSVRLSFQAKFPNAEHYLIKRSVNGGAFEPLTTLAVAVYDSTYRYTDTGVDAADVYRYRIGVVLAVDVQYWHFQTFTAQPLKTIKIYLRHANADLQDQVAIGYNNGALDGWDSLDVEKSRPKWGTTFVWLASNQTVPRTRDLHRDLRAPYDPLNQCKVWDLEALVSVRNADLVISSNIEVIGEEDYLLLRDERANVWHDLRASDYHWNNGSTWGGYFTLYWGFREPEIIFDDLPRQLVEAGSEIELRWQTFNPAHIQTLELWMYSRSDSLLIDDSLSPWEESYTWQTPETELCGYRLMIKGLDNDGNPLRFLSKNLYDIVPATLQVDIPVGLSVLSLPVLGWSGSVSSFMAPGTQVWKMVPGQGWVSTNNLRSFEAYVIDSPVAFTLSQAGSTLAQTHGEQLSQGWNFIPNPHFHHYDLSQIRFIIDDEYYSYIELAERQLVSQKPYSLTARGWEHVDEIQPNTSFLFYYYDSSPCRIDFNPNVLPAEQRPPLKPWEITLSFYSGEKGRDSIEIGSDERASDTDVTAMDGLKPDGFAAQELQVYILGPDNEHLQSKYKSLYEPDVQSYKMWEFEVVKSSGSPLTIEADLGRLPEDYRAKLIFAGDGHTLEPDQPIQIELPDDVFSGYIVVTRNFSHNLDEYQRPDLKLYPNPFRDAITVSWDNVKSAKKPKAAVYNIKGQKVRSLDIHESSGLLTATWDGRDNKQRPTARGIYLIKIESAGRQMIKKVIKY